MKRKKEGWLMKAKEKAGSSEQKNRLEKHRNENPNSETGDPQDPGRQI